MLTKHVTIFSGGGSNCTKFIVLACRMGIGKRCLYLVVVGSLNIDTKGQVSF